MTGKRTQWYSEHMEGMNEASTGTGVGPDLEQEQRGRVRRLVAELRTGDHRQARKFLATEEGFCCLGVACEVAMAGGLDMVKEERFHKPHAYRNVPVRHFFYNPVAKSEAGSERVLPTAVARWFGFTVPSVVRAFLDDLPNVPANNPKLQIPGHLVKKYSSRFTSEGDEFGAAHPRRKKFEASELNDDVRMTLPDIGECFQYTFLREDWEAEHAKAAG